MSAIQKRKASTSQIDPQNFRIINQINIMHGSRNSLNIMQGSSNHEEVDDGRSWSNFSDI